MGKHFDILSANFLVPRGLSAFRNMNVFATNLEEFPSLETIMNSIGEEQINFVKLFIGSRLISEYHIPSSGELSQHNFFIRLRGNSLRILSIDGNTYLKVKKS